MSPAAHGVRAIRRLTDTPLFHEAMPRWSPDGRHIVFYRQEGTVNKGVDIVSPLGGPERRIAERGGAPSWTPDSRSLVMLGPARTGFAVFEHVLETGARRQLTRPPNGFSDISPQVSPDGATLAFVRSSVHFFSQAAVFVVPMSGDEPKRLTEWSWMSGGIAWTPDGREILFPRIDTSGSRVYRISADGRAPPRVVPDIPIGTNVVSISGRSAAGTFRVAFTHGDADIGLQLVDLHSATSDGVVANVTPFCPATRMDTPGRFSHDGRLVAFTSDRGGNWQVWLTAPTGAGLRSVPGLERPLDVGSWSPDRRFFAVDAIVDDHVRVYIMAAEDGRPRRLTQQSANESDPQWSRDGRWIYYASDASGRSEIWKIPSGDGKALQITTDGAFEPREAPDGASIYYIAAPRSNGLRAGSTVKQVPVNGGSSREVLAGVSPGAWDVTDEGIVYVTGMPGPVQPGRSPDAVHFYRFSDRRVQRLGTLPFLVARFGASRLLSVSRDGRQALISQIDRYERDIMVADHFH
jgi:Tol biopolymer transport system component